jgi:hypothetical protein
MRQPDSNVKLERSLHLLKQKSGILSIDEGMQIDLSDEQCPNAESPRAENLEPDSNVKLERSLHLLKQKFGILYIDEGMQID